MGWSGRVVADKEVIGTQRRWREYCEACPPCCDSPRSVLEVQMHRSQRA